MNPPEKQYFEISHRAIQLPLAFLTTSGTLIDTTQRHTTHVLGEGTLHIRDGTGTVHWLFPVDAGDESQPRFLVTPKGAVSVPLPWLLC